MPAIIHHERREQRLGKSGRHGHSGELITEPINLLFDPCEEVHILQKIHSFLILGLKTKLLLRLGISNKAKKEDQCCRLVCAHFQIKAILLHFSVRLVALKMNSKQELNY